MRGFCPPRQKYCGDSVLADQIAGILSAGDSVLEPFAMHQVWRGHQRDTKVAVTFSHCLMQYVGNGDALVFG